MYRIGILEKDEAYLGRLVGFLREHHKDSFEINVVDQEEADWDHLSLDDLDLEAVPYDALFFGDGIEVAGTLPAELVTGFITEKEFSGSDSGCCINKYQSMENIYKHMLKICEEGRSRNQANAGSSDLIQEPAAWHGLRPETVEAEGETYRVYHMEEGEVDRLSVRMLTANHIKGLPQTEYDGGELRCRITGMKSLYDMVESDNTAEGKQELLKIFGDMVSTALSLEEYMLLPDRLLLDPKEIYVDPFEGEVILPYIPLKSTGEKNIREFLEEIRGLCSVLLDGLCREQPADKNEPEVYYASGEDFACASGLSDNVDGYGSTEEFENLRKNAQESLKLKNETEVLDGKEKKIPYIIRKRTGEKILINRNIFKLGKDEMYVDYCIRDNPTVSRNHADIVRKPDGFYLVDKGSLNHTFVNGKKLEKDEYRKLKNGCLLQLSDEVFEFVAGRLKRKPGSAGSRD